MKKRLTLIAILLLSAVVFCIWWQNRITISVVIPVYNAEKYIGRCLDSILVQTGKFEIIAVNDGSKDSSLQILQEYAKKHNNIRVIDQENQGIAGARNAGLRAAQGKYVTFVDNDDWLEPNAFDIARKIIKQDKPDILLGSYYDVYDKEWVRNTRGEEATKDVPEISKFPRHDMDKLSLFSPFYAKNAYKDLYYDGEWVIHTFFLKEFLNRYKLEFPQNMTNMEDLIFMYRVYAYNPFVSVTTAPIYNYYNRVDSESKSMSTLNVLKERKKYLHETAEYKSYPRQIQKWIDDNFLSTIFVGIANMQRKGIPLIAEIDKINDAYQSMLEYNSKELESCRYFGKLKKVLQNISPNQPL